MNIKAHHQYHTSVIDLWSSIYHVLMCYSWGNALVHDMPLCAYQAAGRHGLTTLMSTYKAIRELMIVICFFFFFFGGAIALFKGSNHCCKCRMYIVLYYYKNNVFIYVYFKSRSNPINVMRPTWIPFPPAYNTKWIRQTGIDQYIISLSFGKKSSFIDKLKTKKIIIINKETLKKGKCFGHF